MPPKMHACPSRSLSATFPEHTRDALAARASRTGRSLQEYLSGELQRPADEPSVDDWIFSARTFAGTNSADSADRILSDLDADRR